MLNSPMLSIFQHFQVIPLACPLSPSGSSPDGEPRGFGDFLRIHFDVYENSLDSQPPSCDFWGEALSSS